MKETHFPSCYDEYGITKRINKRTSPANLLRASTDPPPCQRHHTRFRNVCVIIWNMHKFSGDKQLVGSRIISQSQQVTPPSLFLPVSQTKSLFLCSRREELKSLLRPGDQVVKQEEDQDQPHGHVTQNTAVVLPRTHHGGKTLHAARQQTCCAQEVGVLKEEGGRSADNKRPTDEQRARSSPCCPDNRSDHRPLCRFQRPAVTETSQTLGRAEVAFARLIWRGNLKGHRNRLTDFSLDTLDVRLSARRRFSASSRSSTEFPERDRNPVRQS